MTHVGMGQNLAVNQTCPGAMTHMTHVTTDVTNNGPAAQTLGLPSLFKAEEGAGFWSRRRVLRARCLSWLGSLGNFGTLNPKRILMLINSI